MIRFVDIKTGNVFDAFGGENPYIFWFDGEQSVDMIYNKPICFISHTEYTTVSISKNKIFKLLKLKSDQHNIEDYQLNNINGFDYCDIQDLIEDKNEIFIKGTPYRGIYIYMFYVMCSYDKPGEYVESFYLNDNDGHTYEYKVGADLYEENEFHYINLSNKGIEIPKSIQKAIYCTNVHEEKYDEIVLNRKWKELLSNFWDIIDNKGSYKSLYNSLKWFEYGDIIKLFEIWRHKDPCHGEDIYDERSIKEVLGDKYFETINGFSKTTYIAISSALQSIVKVNDNVKYDKEKNPIIEQIVRDWSIKDLSLKLSMLGFFYKKFFMPIHLDLIRCTIEDIVYSNTIKLFSAGLINREDNVNHYMDFKCNIKNGDIFRLEPVSVRVGEKTLFSNIYNKDWDYLKYNNIDIVGVQKDNPSFDLQKDMQSQIKTYMAQRFNGVGAVINFKIDIPLADGDFIKRSALVIKGDKTERWKTVEDRQIIQNGKIEFDLLCTKEKEYDIRFEFDSAEGYVFVKRVQFNVIDTSKSSIKVYKIQNIRIPDINNVGINEYSYGRMIGNKPCVNYKQFIPMRLANPLLNRDYNYKGVCLNHLLILKDTKINDYIKDNYFIQTKNTDSGPTYTICLSKLYGFKPNRRWINSNEIYKDEYVFYPDFHELVELGNNKYSKHYDLTDYTITDDDALCIIPDISYGKFIEESQWEFINVSDPEKSPIIPPTDIKEPFIAPESKSFLPPGYYNVVFKYRLSGENKINKIELNSAFLKV